MQIGLKDFYLKIRFLILPLLLKLVIPNLNG